MASLNAAAPRLQPILKMGRSIADLAGTEEIELAYNTEAIRYGSLNRRLGKLVNKTMTPLQFMILLQTLDANKSICMPGTNHSPLLANYVKRLTLQHPLHTHGIKSRPSGSGSTIGTSKNRAGSG